MKQLRNNFISPRNFHSSAKIQYQMRQQIIQWNGGRYSLFLLPIHPQARPVHCWWLAGPFVWNGLPLAQRLLPRVLSYTFYTSLKTVFFSRARVWSASE